jgi:hypothetical protein
LDPHPEEEIAMNIAMPQRSNITSRPLADKVSLVTGSTSAIGLGIARALAAAGSSVVLQWLIERAPWLDACDPLEGVILHETHDDGRSNEVPTSAMAKPSTRRGEKSVPVAAASRPEWPRASTVGQNRRPLAERAPEANRPDRGACLWRGGGIQAN